MYCKRLCNVVQFLDLSNKVKKKKEKRKVVVSRDFILHAVTTFWVMLFVGIYTGRAFV